MLGWILNKNELFCQSIGQLILYRYAFRGQTIRNLIEIYFIFFDVIKDAFNHLLKINIRKF